MRKYLLLFIFFLVSLTSSKLGLAGSVIDYFDLNKILESDVAFVEKTLSKFNYRYSAVFDSISLEEASRLIREKTGIRIFVESEISDRTVQEYFSDEEVSEILKRTAISARSFVVFRKNLLLFSKRVRILVELERPLLKRELKDLSDIAHETDSIFFVGHSRALCQLTRSGLDRFRDFLIQNSISIRILKTDAVFSDQIRL